MSTIEQPDNKDCAVTDGQRVHTVLYVEDHPVNVLLMQALFSNRPQARLVIATTGEEGLQAAAAYPPDLLLLDLRLPDCHGTELLQRLRGLPGLAEVPAVAVTAEDTSGVSERGFGEIWHKPMDMNATLGRLDRLLGARDSSTATWVHAAARSRGAPEQVPFSGTTHVPPGQSSP